jgi:hypothetical protein
MGRDTRGANRWFGHQTMICKRTLAPFDNNLRVNVAIYYINTQQYYASIYTLKPLTTAAHKPEQRRLAFKMITEAQLKIDSPLNSP